MTFNPQFDVYAAFYDLMYKDKDYSGEARYIDQLVRKFSKKTNNEISLLDLACGTGKHLFELSTLGYKNLSGSDIASAMIQVAKKNAEQKNLDIPFHNFSFQESEQIGKKHDVIISMFSAINYLTAYEDQSRTLANIHALLYNGGLFIFDYWNGCAVTESYSPVKVLRKRQGDTEILRISETSLDLINQNATVKFTCNYFESDKRIAEFEETHFLHYYYFSEMKNLLASHHFEILHISPFMKVNEAISPDDWNISIIARKV
jgi:2-polyprenyl-3-methyl-5-hydroxy-6-metoxy-1,4-benzoquinol methylase